MIKNLKFIKLFEAFESEKISKTLKFINSDSKQVFLEQLNKIADRIDFPISKYSDDFFQYLNFDKALELNYNVGDEPCDETSEQAFPEYAVSGDKCEGGRIKRKWGNSIRNVSCPKCSGSGIKPKTSSEIKWIKFWFNKDGQFIRTTAVDGLIRKSDIKSKISQNLNDYKEIGRISTPTDFLQYESGTPVQIRIDGSTLIGTIFIQGSSSYIIQDRKDGSTPSGKEWKIYGENGWQVNGGDYSGTPIVLRLVKPEDESSDKSNPYDWNAALHFDRIGLSVRKDGNIEKNLETAHFAIVMDFLELKKSSYKKKSVIKSEREESKKGASKFIPDEEVKRINIDRYFSKLSQIDFERKEDIVQFKNIKSLLTRYLGSNYLGFHILQGNQNFEYFYNYLYEIIKSSEIGNEDLFNTNVYKLNNLVKEQLNGRTAENLQISNNIDNFIRGCSAIRLKSDSSEISKKKLEFINKIIELNQSIFNKVKNTKTEDLEDLEILQEKLNAIYNISRNSRRIPGYTLIRNGISRIDSSYGNLEERFFTNLNSEQRIDPDFFDYIISSIDRLIKIIERI